VPPHPTPWKGCSHPGGGERGVMIEHDGGSGSFGEKSLVGLFGWRVTEYREISVQFVRVFMLRVAVSLCVKHIRVRTLRACMPCPAHERMRKHGGAPSRHHVFRWHRGPSTRQALSQMSEPGT
jgi:hypothetical protein